MFAVETHRLWKVFSVPQTGSFLSSWLGRGRPASDDAGPRGKIAVADLDLRIRQGERVAFIGPNGAGKSTTVKMLCGVLQPSSGVIRVCGLEPVHDQKRLVFHIGAVFGQKTQLWERLTLDQCLDMLAVMYGLEGRSGRGRLDELIRLFQAGDFRRVPLAKLSLGQRMRCELIASLAHRPKVLFLDEPTIGLDVNAKAAIREYLRDVADAEGTTVLLTSHDTLDMESVCGRVVMISQGRLVIDEPIADLRRRYIRKKYLRLVTREAAIEGLAAGFEVTANGDHQASLTIDLERMTVGAAVAELSRRCEIRDMTIEDPPLEDVLRQIHREHGA